MNQKSILNCLLLMIPTSVFAHPGHAPDTAFAGLSGSLLWCLTTVTAAGLIIAAGSLWRRRKSLRADD